MRIPFRPLLLALALASSACSTLDAINPFTPSAPKLASLPTISAPADVRTLWSYAAGKAGDYLFTPAVVGRTVYVANRDGQLAKLEDGKLVWRVNVGQPLSTGVAANLDMLVVATAKGDVLAFATEDGRSLWQAKVSSEVLAVPTIGEAGVAVKSGDNRIYLFDAAKGTRKWVYQRATPALSVRGSGSPVFADQYLFVGFAGGKVVALSLQNGAPVWEGVVALPKGATELDRVADVVAPPVTDSRQLCAVAFQGRVACFDMGQGGAMLWSRDLSSTSELAVDGRYVFAVDDAGVVHALDRSSGSTLWKQDKLKGRQLSSPIVRQGMLAVADAEGYVHFLSREEGAFVARLKVDGSPVRVPMRGLGGAVVVQTTNGTVSAIEVQ